MPEQGNRRGRGRADQDVGDEAVRTYETAAAIRERPGTPGPPVQRAQRDRDSSEACDAMGADGFRAAWQAGREAADRGLRTDEA